jgi:hypothetical protein
MAMTMTTDKEGQQLLSDELRLVCAMKIEGGGGGGEIG